MISRLFFPVFGVLVASATLVAQEAPPQPASAPSPIVTPAPSPEPGTPAASAPAPASTPMVAPAAAPVPVPAPVPEKQASLDLLLDPAVVGWLESLPVQEAGRVKPLDTVARFRLLKATGSQTIYLTDNGKSKGEPLVDPATNAPITTAKGKSRKITAVQWLIITWLRPDIGREIRGFTVDNSEAVIEIGMAGKGKRDRYSYNELVEGRTLLMKKLENIREVDTKARTPSQRALGKLAMDFLDYEMMLGHFDFARAPFGESASLVPAEILAPGASGKTRIAELLPKISAYLQAHPEAAAPMNNPWLRDYFRTMLGGLMSGSSETILRIFPPADPKEEIWHGPGTILQIAIEKEIPSQSDLDYLSAYEAIYRDRLDEGAFKKSVQALQDLVVENAAARNESGHVDMEVSYHKADYFFYCVVLSVLALILLALSWVSPKSRTGKTLRVVSLVSIWAVAVLGTVGIVIRCLIMERPPITTLYETILFITVTGVLGALLVEWVNRKGLGHIGACLVGTAGFFLSIRFMNLEKSDTLQELQAVLITNFWLSTHVPCINLGYAAGMVAAVFSMIYIVRRIFGVVKLGDAEAKDITRTAYAFIMAGLFLSLVGTVLGGIWANYSWGRFWGWDPKENGALMIVLMNLIILHARLGGYIREVGFHACNIILGMVVVFSWFGTNQLGVGLHAYGFTDGVWKWLYIFWASQGLFLVAAGVISMLDKQHKALTGLGSMPLTSPQDGKKAVEGF